MHVRVVRFTGVSAERLESLLARIRESEGPPPGVPTTGLKMMFDEAQGTAVVLQYFATAEDMVMEVGMVEWELRLRDAWLLAPNSLPKLGKCHRTNA